jgi:protein-tyrosine-phosphatase
MLIRKDKTVSQEIDVTSAGIVTPERIQKLKAEGIEIQAPLFGRRPPPCVIFYMALIKGLDCSQYRSKALVPALANEVSLIIAVQKDIKDTVLTVYPGLGKKVVSLEELSHTLRFHPLVKEPPGLMPLAEFCMQECDHWYIMKEALLEIEECLEKATDKILDRIS